MWTWIKERFLYWLCFIIFIMISILIIFGLTTELPKLFGESEEKIVEETYTSKGLYFGLQYYVKLVDGEAHRILKNDFLSLEKGDVFKLFFNHASFIDGFIYVSLMLMFLCLMLSLVYLFTAIIFGQMRWFKWMDMKRERVKKVILSSLKIALKRLRISKRTALIFLILLLSLVPLLVIKNVVYKLVPIGKTEVVAEIIDREKDRTSSPRATVYTYTLTYTYTDQEGQLYKTKKNVSSSTYHLYNKNERIPIMYRNNLPYDTYIVHRTIRGYVSPFFSVATVLLVFLSYLVYFLTKRYIKVWGIPFINKRTKSNPN